MAQLVWPMAGIHGHKLEVGSERFGQRERFGLSVNSLVGEVCGHGLPVTDPRVQGGVV